MTTKDHEQKLKRFLAKCLPEELDYSLKYQELSWKGSKFVEVKDTELLGICNRIEMGLSEEDQRDYRSRLMLNSDGPKATHRTVESALCHATWIERASALAELKGESLV